jgi:hypothetical protein
LCIRSRAPEETGGEEVEVVVALIVSLVITFAMTAGIAISQQPFPGGAGGKGKGGADASHTGLFQNPQVRAEHMPPMPRLGKDISVVISLAGKPEQIEIRNDFAQGKRFAWRG